MKFQDVLEKRQSIRKYIDKEVDWRDVVQVVNAATETPMAGNIFTLRFVVVQDATKRQEIADAAGQDFIAKASWIIAVCSDNTRIFNAYDERGLKYSRQQAGASIENMLLKITELGLASCWVGAFDDEVVKRILGIPQNIEVEALIPIAYQSGFVREARRIKPEIKAVTYFDRWKQGIMKPVKAPEPK